MRECPCCGAVQPPRHGVTVGDGDLAEFGARKSGKPQTVRDQIAAQGKRAVYMQLLWICEERGHSLGWAAHNYKDVFGDWPRGLSKTAAAEPTQLMRRWIQSRNIAFARARQNGEARYAV
jgi:hypothetical protein